MPRIDHQAPSETSPARTKPLPPLKEPASRTDRVRDALREAILDGALPPGRPLVERELAELYGVSKTPVREALKQLHSTGLVEINTYQGVSVRQPDETLVRELYTARCAVEPDAVRLASELRGAVAYPEARRALNDAAALIGSGETHGLGTANRRFHRELYTACDNSFLCDFLDRLQDLTAFVAGLGWRLRATFEEEAAEHLAILEAMEQGDAERAEHLTLAHIRKAQRTLSNTLGVEQ
ncbi:GntR family transcriptional regulator [Streptomyces sp. NBC_00687]|uniref:GntR family transcriptional regulator n=1 Tax=Streptomyces sp. NBC_00687 TaxID=2975807 RepID=UPI00224F6EBA|nr:GntR family transcriptional regulator [Streptomyces sp. NBC_00687]MCX4918905.1 GntR family transcriptional regulator [Streptomyces sp. NBC_00687]